MKISTRFRQPYQPNKITMIYFPIFIRYESYQYECKNATAKRMRARFRVIKVAFFTVCFDEMQIMNEKE